MRRGEVRLVDLEPVQGSAASKVRPAVVVSNNGANAAVDRSRRSVVTIVPVTTNLTRVHPFQVALPAAATGLDRDSKAQAEQVRSLSALRIGRRIGSVPDELMAALDDALRLHLDL